MIRKTLKSGRISGCIPQQPLSALSHTLISRSEKRAVGQMMLNVGNEETLKGFLTQTEAELCQHEIGCKSLLTQSL